MKYNNTTLVQGVSENFLIMYTNADSLPNTVQELKTLINNTSPKPKVIALTEVKHKSKWNVALTHTHTHTHTCLTALCPGLPRCTSTRKAKPIWTLLKQETVSGSGISWSICKSASCSRQITMPIPHHSSFFQAGCLPAAQPTASKHWRHGMQH